MIGGDGDIGAGDAGSKGCGKKILRWKRTDRRLVRENRKSGASSKK